jgi:L-amino acid N-acyltransferase YncA
MTKIIRNAELSDAAAIRGIYAPFVSDEATSFELVPPDTDVIADRIREVLPSYPWLVFEWNGEVLGYAYGSSHRSRPAYQWSVEVSVYLDPRIQRRGVGRALYSTLLEFLRRQGYANAYAGITLPNPASVGLHAAMGFSSIGVFSRIGYKFGQWHDVGWMQLRLHDDFAPSTLLPPETVFAVPSVQLMLRESAQATRL